MLRPRRAWIPAALLATSCVYFNAMYDANKHYGIAVDRGREGHAAEARLHYDSVVHFANEILKDHPESEYAAPAAILKARSEIARSQWEAAEAAATLVPALTSDSSLIGLAAGLEGTARRMGGGDLVDAEALLTRALDSGPSAEDSAQFLFNRGLARLELGEVEAAAADLEAVGAQRELAPEVRLDLARGLADVARYDEAMRLTSDLLARNRYASFGTAMDAHLDSLALHAPAGLEETTGRLLREPELTGTKYALLHFYRGRSQESLGDTASAMEEYDLARENTGQGRYAAEAAYRWALLRMRTAERPADIVGVEQALAKGRNVPEPAASAHAAELSREVREFANLVDAVGSRGGTAAEAALRAAEIAGFDLDARRVARGLYVRYLALAPGSPWRAKAIAGALALAATPAGEWSGDRGAATDRELRDELASLPADDPYRVSIDNLARSPVIDSAYVESERDLERRIVEIRMLYDTTAVLVTPGDTTQAAPESGQGEGEGGDAGTPPAAEQI